LYFISSILCHTNPGIKSCDFLSPLEKSYITLLNILSSFFFAYILFISMKTFNSMGQNQDIINEERISLHKYMQKHNVSKPLQEKAIKYMEYIHKEGVDEEEQ
jgi:hypothetical protein